jgi:hypothetical protein
MDEGFEVPLPGPHLLLELFVDDVLHVVHFVVRCADIKRQSHIRVDECVETLLEHLLSLQGHRAEVERMLRAVQGAQKYSRLRDIHREVPYSLEIVVDLQDRHEVSEIVGYRLMECEDFEALFLEVDLSLVDLNIPIDHLSGKLRVPGINSLYRQAQMILDLSAYGQDLFIQPFNLAAEPGAKCRCHRPFPMFVPVMTITRQEAGTLSQNGITSSRSRGVSLSIRLTVSPL